MIFGYTVINRSVGDSLSTEEINKFGQQGMKLINFCYVERGDSSFIHYIFENAGE